MRRLYLIAATAVLVGGCGRGGGETNAANQADVVSAANIVSNDVTAIDAVTADAANMAADVPIDENLGNDLDNMLNDSGNVSAGSRPKASKAAPKPEAADNEAADSNAL